MFRLPRIRFSISTMLVLVAGLSFLIVWYKNKNAVAIEYTGDPRDVYVVGDYYLCGSLEPGSDETIYFKSGHFERDIAGLVYVKIGSQKLYVNPSIQVPEMPLDFTIQPDGNVTQKSDSKSWSEASATHATFGALQFAILPSLRETTSVLRPPYLPAIQAMESW